MRIKRYVGMNVREALRKIKEELGPEAVILNTRKLPKWPRLRFLDFLAKERVEVLAAVGESEGRLESQERPVERGFISERGLSLERELKEIKETLADIAHREGEVIPFKGRLREIYERLIDAEVDRELARALVDAAQEPTRGLTAPTDTLLVGTPLSPDVKGLYNARALRHSNTSQASPEARVLTKLEGMIPTSGAVSIRPGLQRNIVLVGPTGVGKTTTLAKLASYFALSEKRRVALITADRYRIAAVEQLKTYGEIMGVPVEVVYMPSEMRAALARHKDKDLVLIDTAGRSPKNEMQISELRAMVDAAAPDEVHLVLSAATNLGDLAEYVERFSISRADRIIFTKLDETRRFGAILNVAFKSQKPISYVTTGQSVPEDIEVANPRRLARLIFYGSDEFNSGEEEIHTFPAGRV